MNNLKMQSPWQSFQGKVKALFENDHLIEVGDLIDNGNGSYILPIEVKKHTKYEALARLLPRNMIFGNIKVEIQLYDTENGLSSSEEIAKLFEAAFEGNAIFRDVKVAQDMTGTLHNFVRFEPVVLQFFNDDLSDYNGNWSGLAMDIARDELFNEYAEMGVHFCTAPHEKAINPIKNDN